MAEFNTGLFISLGQACASEIPRHFLLRSFVVCGVNLVVLAPVRSLPPLGGALSQPMCSELPNFS